MVPTLLPRWASLRLIITLGRVQAAWFVSKARLRSLGFTRTTQEFFPGGPDLAVEVLAPSNTRAEMAALKSV